MAEYLRPLPVVDQFSQAYWEGAKQRRLVITRCGACRFYAHPPRPGCPRCQSEAMAGEAVSGRGTVYSYSVMHNRGNPGFDEDLPYAVVIVELEEQPGLITVGNLRGCAPGEIRIGMAVEVIFEDATAEITLPQWRPAGGPA